MKKEEKTSTIIKKLKILGENKEIKLKYLNKILSEIDLIEKTQKCVLKQNPKENYLLIENTANSLEDLIKEYKKIGKSFNENQLLYIIYIFVELGSILDDNFCYNQEICVNSVKIYLNNISKLKIKLLNPFFNDKFRNEFIMDFLEIFPNIPENKTFEFNLFKFIERKKFLKNDKEDEILKTLYKLDQYIYIKSKNCFYQLFFMVMCLAVGLDENEFKLEEKLFYEKIKETIENLNIKKENKDFFRFVLVRKNFDDLISFAELKNYLDIQLSGNFEEMKNDKFFQIFNLFFKNLNESRNTNFEFENDLNTIKNIFPQFKQKNQSKRSLRISLDHQNNKNSVSINKENEYNFNQHKEIDGDIRTKIDNLTYKIKKYRESIKSIGNDIDENYQSNNRGENSYINKEKKKVKKSAIYCDVNLTKKFEKYKEDVIINNSKNKSVSSSKKVRYLTIVNNKNTNRIIKRSNITNLSKKSNLSNNISNLSNRSLSKNPLNSQSRVVSSRVIYIKTDLRSNKKSNINNYKNNLHHYLPKRSYYKEQVTPSLTPIKNLRRSYSQNNFKSGLENRFKNKNNMFNLAKDLTKKKGLYSSRYELNNKENLIPKQKKMDYEKLNSSMRSFKNINISNFSKNEFNYSKLYEKLCPKKRNKSLDGSCFSFNNSFINSNRSTYLKKGSTRNTYKNVIYKEKMNEYNF